MCQFPLVEYLGIRVPDAAAVLREHIRDGIDRSGKQQQYDKSEI